MILKKGTQVKIITGKDKGKTGEILEINKKLNKIKEGEKVSIIECKPISKKKTWQVIK